MLKNLAAALSLISRQIIILLMIGGLIYLIRPRIEGPLAQATPIPTPANQATTDYLNALATAEASLKETETATPGSVRTATLTPSPSPTPLPIVIVTETPTALNIITVAAEAARATAVATAIGTYTPIPYNWVVPIVVTPEPPTDVPGNAATATFQVAEATAIAFVDGTPTPAPINVWTATPTPFMLPVVGEVATPWIPPEPTPTTVPIPQALVGKILFLSNRSGGPLPLPEPLVYAIDPDGSNLAVLLDNTFYETALTRDAYSADQRYVTLAQEIPRSYAPKTPSEPALAVFIYDYGNSMLNQVTSFGIGDAWNPVWSPTREQIAFVSTSTNHAEIWIINRDGSEQRQLTLTDEATISREVGKNTFIPSEENDHPSWSPDGSKIVFSSSRTGHQQIWVMNADGSNAYSLSTTNLDDWDPVWVKYTDPVRVPTIQPRP